MMHFTSGNHIRLLRNGTEYFPALAEAITHARHEIYLQTYIYELDSTGIRIGNALKEAAIRGVAVKLLLDGFGSKDLPKTYIQELEKCGVQLMFYRPKISPWTLQKKRLRRMHRKIALIDQEIGFVGGINIIDDHNTPHQASPRIDYAVLVQGPVLAAIQESVHKLWRPMRWSRLKEAYTSAPNLNAMPAQYIPNHGVKVAFVIRDNMLHRRDIEKAYLSAIAHAKIEIIIANAYFVPGRKFRQALLAAAARGVKVKLLLQGRKEYILMFATHAFYSQFLSAGIEIYEYRKSFMHSKVAVIDDFWATVGSANIDPFSLLLANEANIVVQNKKFATELKSDIEVSIQNAYHVTQLEWEQDSKLKNFFSWVVYGVVKGFLSIVGSNDEKK
jgi:cardiolipin synthase A/B